MRRDLWRGCPIQNARGKAVMLGHSEPKEQGVRTDFVGSGVLHEISQQRAFDVGVVTSDPLQTCLYTPILVADAAINEIGAVSIVPVDPDFVELLLQSSPIVYPYIILHIQRHLQPLQIISASYNGTFRLSCLSRERLEDHPL